MAVERRSRRHTEQLVAAHGAWEALRIPLRVVVDLVVALHTRHTLAAAVPEARHTRAVAVPGARRSRRRDTAVAVQGIHRMLVVDSTTC